MALSSAECAAMYALFAAYFEGAGEQRFLQDLAGKNWVILLRDEEEGAIQGFSTLALYTTFYEGRVLSVVYSGDTIIRPAYWGTPALPRTWIQSVLALVEAMPQPLYWLLISSGYKTYRFLPVFYKWFYPRYDQPTPPAVQRLIYHLARERFGDDYHAEKGIVRFGGGGTPLRAGIAELHEERLHNPHIAYFLAHNPGYGEGDELVCLTQVHPDNFTPAGRRMAG
jgi:hypothetical protein